MCTEKLLNNAITVFTGISLGTFKSNCTRNCNIESASVSCYVA